MKSIKSLNSFLSICFSRQTTTLLFLLSSISCTAQTLPVHPSEESGSNDKVDTTLLGKDLPPMSLLQLQAEERRRFYDDLSAERQALHKELTAREEELRERQRQQRKEFKPESHSIAERREFFLGQRQEMLAFKKSQKQAYQNLKSEQNKRRDEFHARQKQERMGAIRDIRLRLLKKTSGQ